MITNPTKTRDPIGNDDQDVAIKEISAGIKPVTANHKPATSRIFILGFARRNGCGCCCVISCMAWLVGGLSFSPQTPHVSAVTEFLEPHAVHSNDCDIMNQKTIGTVIESR